MMSLPAPPEMLSLPLLPVMLSLPLVPLTCCGELRVMVFSFIRLAVKSTRELALSPSLSVST
jgi:hypothetical protein